MMIEHVCMQQSIVIYQEWYGEQQFSNRRTLILKEKSVFLEQVWLSLRFIVDSTAKVTCIWATSVPSRSLT